MKKNVAGKSIKAIVTRFEHLKTLETKINFQTDPLVFRFVSRTISASLAVVLYNIVADAHNKIATAWNSLTYNCAVVKSVMAFFHFINQFWCGAIVLSSHNLQCNWLQFRIQKYFEPN